MYFLLNLVDEIDTDIVMMEGRPGCGTFSRNMEEEGPLTHRRGSEKVSWKAPG